MIGFSFGCVALAATLLDFGHEGVGGYPVLEVESVSKGPATVRVAYATHPDGLGPTGDFDYDTRATYLGEDFILPILPASADRYDLFEVTTAGVYRAALQQGVVRYARVTVETPGADVKVKGLRFANDGTFSEDPVIGSFACSDARLNGLWKASARTCQLTMIPERTKPLTVRSPRTNAVLAVARPYLADGAKRDRLVWSGDLWWAQRMVYAAFGPGVPHMGGSLEMLADNQTPEGFVQAAPLPERHAPPQKGDWGVFQSDEFSAWFVPVAWDHFLRTGDRDLAVRLWPNVARAIAYLTAHQGEDGVFVQRLETSKHACHHWDVGDVSHRSYENILLWKTLVDGAAYARELGHADRERDWTDRAERLAASVRRRFWNGDRGFFILSEEWPVLGFEACALALAARFCTDGEAQRMAPHLVRVGHGKFQMLAARGKFEYGMTAAALKCLADHNWYAILDPGWQGLRTTYECMALIRKGQGDEVHPDTAIGSLYSDYLLGLEPLAPGWSRFRWRPQPDGKLAFAEGKVPTRHGFVSAGWQFAEGAFSGEIEVPEGCVAEVELPFAAEASDRRRELAAGRHHVDVRIDRQSAAWRRAVAVPPAPQSGKTELMTWSAANSVEQCMWRVNALSAPLFLEKFKGYSSEASPTADTNLWIQLDMGIEEEVRRIAFHPQTVEPAADGGIAGFPVNLIIEGAAQPGRWTVLKRLDRIARPADAAPLEVDLYTVIGYPRVRYLRFSTDRLGVPPADGGYRLQFKRIVVDRERLTRERK